MLHGSVLLKRIYLCIHQEQHGSVHCDLFLCGLVFCIMVVVVVVISMIIIMVFPLWDQCYSRATSLHGRQLHGTVMQSPASVPQGCPSSL